MPGKRIDLVKRSNPRRRKRASSSVNCGIMLAACGDSPSADDKLALGQVLKILVLSDFLQLLRTHITPGDPCRIQNQSTFVRGAMHEIV